MKRFFRSASWFILWVPASAFGQTLTAGSVAGTTPTVNLFSPDPKSLVTSPKLQWNLPFNTTQHTFLFGPEVRVFTSNRFMINAWAVAGVANRFALFAPLSQPTDASLPRAWDPSSLLTPAPFTAGNAIAASFGGSVDYRINDHLTYRIVQPELLVIPSKNSDKNSDVRVSTGMRFTFGKL